MVCAARRYKLQNTKREHYIEQVRLLFRCMKAKARGWRPSLLKQPRPIEEENEEADSSKRFFIHLKCNPRGITRQQESTFDDTRDTLTRILTMNSSLQGFISREGERLLPFAPLRKIKVFLNSEGFWRRKILSNPTIFQFRPPLPARWKDDSY